MDNIPQTVSDMSQDAVMAALGMKPKQEQGNRLPLLKINMQEVDDNDREIKKGLFVLSGAELEEPLYASKVMIRVFCDKMQYSHFDPKEGKLVSKSIIHSMGDEAIDTVGSVRCGKPLSKEFHAMDTVKKEKFKDIKCFRLLFSQISMEGVDANGKKVKLINHPALFRVAGASFMQFNKQVVEPCNKLKKHYSSVTSTLTSKRQKNGSLVYYTPDFSPELNTEKVLSEQDHEFLKNVLLTIQGENTMVKNQYDEALRKMQTEGFVDVSDDVGQILEADFR